MLPGLLGAGVTQLNLAVDVIIASLLPAGTVSLLYYADRVQQLPLGVIGTAVGTALLPLLSRQVRAGEGEAAVGTLNRAIEYALFLTLPAAVALIVSAYPVMWALFGRGAFSRRERPAVGAGARCIRVGAAGIRPGEGAGAGILRARRHGDAGEGRRCRGGAEPGIECRLHGAAATDRPGSGDQPGGDIQRVWAWRDAGTPRPAADGCAIATTGAADAAGVRCDGPGAVGNAARTVCSAAAWRRADRSVGGAGRRRAGVVRGCGSGVRRRGLAGNGSDDGTRKAAWTCDNCAFG